MTEGPGAPARVALYPGTFDPVTHGHLDLVRRGARIFDAVVVAVARGSGGTHFPLEARVRMLESLVAPYENVEVRPFEGLLVDFARAVGASVLLRGVRGVRDLEYEMEMACANRELAPDVETVFLAPSPRIAYVSSSLVREVASLGGDVSAWVPPAVVAALAERTPAPPAGKTPRRES